MNLPDTSHKFFVLFHQLRTGNKLHIYRGFCTRTYGLMVDVRNAVSAQVFSNKYTYSEACKFLDLFDLKQSALVHWNVNITSYKSTSK